MDSFEKMLSKHLKQIKSKLNISIAELENRAAKHDVDKKEDKYINSIYTEHFPKLKEIPFGTSEYFEYEKKYFDQAHQLHAQNRHHYYSYRNNLTDINLFDVLEAIIDISESAKQYDNFNNYQNAFKNKGIYDYDLEELVNNTIKFLNKENKI